MSRCLGMMAAVSNFLRVRLEDFSLQKVFRAILKYSLTKTTSLSGLAEERPEAGHEEKPEERQENVS